MMLHKSRTQNEVVELSIDVGTQTDHIHCENTVTVHLDSLAALNHSVVSVKKLEESGIGKTYKRMTKSTYKRIRRGRPPRVESKQNEAVNKLGTVCKTSPTPSNAIPKLENVNCSQGYTKIDKCSYTNIKEQQMESVSTEIGKCSYTNITEQQMQVDDDDTDNPEYVDVSRGDLDIFDDPEDIYAINREHINLRVAHLENVESLSEIPAVKTIEDTILRTLDTWQGPTETPVINNVLKTLTQSANTSTRKEQQQKLELKNIVNQTILDSSETSYITRNHKNYRAIDVFPENAINYPELLARKEKQKVREVENRVRNINQPMQPAKIIQKQLTNYPLFVNTDEKQNKLKAELLTNTENAIVPSHCHIQPSRNYKTSKNVAANLKDDKLINSVDDTVDKDSRILKHTLYSDLAHRFKIKSSYVELVRLDDQQLERITGDSITNNEQNCIGSNLNQTLEECRDLNDDNNVIQESPVREIPPCSINDVFHVEICDTCNKTFKTRKLLKIHCDKVHRNLFPILKKQRKSKKQLNKNVMTKCVTNISRILQFQQHFFKQTKSTTKEPDPLRKKSLTKQKKKRKNLPMDTVILVSDNDDDDPLEVTECGTYTEGNKEKENQLEVTEILSETDTETNKDIVNKKIEKHRGREIENIGATNNQNIQTNKELIEGITKADHNKETEIKQTRLGVMEVTSNKAIDAIVPMQVDSEEEIVDILTVNRGTYLPIKVPEVLWFPEIIENPDTTAHCAHDHSYVQPSFKSRFRQKSPNSSKTKVGNLNETIIKMKYEIETYKKIQQLLFNHITAGTSVMEEKYNTIVTKFIVEM